MPLVVVSDKFIKEEPTILRYQEKALSLSGDTADVTEVPLGEPWFRVKGKWGSLDNAMKLLDIYDEQICEMKKPFSNLLDTLVVEGNGWTFEVKKKYNKWFASEAKAEVKNLATGDMHTLYICGHWTDWKMQIFDGKKKEGGVELANAEAKITKGDVFADAHAYRLTVLPGVDIALCVILLIAFDRFNNK